jgi:MFS family permease
MKSASRALQVTLRSSSNKNTTLIYILSFIGDLFFPIAVWMFYYLEYISFSEVAIITAVGTIAGIILEIPTGAIADTYGRKTSIVLSYLAFVPTMLLIAFFPTFPVLLLAAILASLVNALYSGSLEALIYDSLKETNQLNRFSEVTSRLEALSWVGLFAGAAIGGVLYSVLPAAPFLAQAVLVGFGVILAGMLHEPKLHSSEEEVSNRMGNAPELHSFHQFLARNVQGFRELFASRVHIVRSVLFIVIESGYMIAAAILGISQAREYGISPEQVGFIFGIGYLGSAAFSYLFPVLAGRFGYRVLLLVSTAVLLGSFLAAPFVPVWLGILLIIARIASSTTFRNIRSIVMNQVITSKNRATSLSTLVLLSQLPYMIAAYPIGIYIEQTSPNQFAFMLGVVLVCVLIPVGVLMRRD